MGEGSTTVLVGESETESLTSIIERALIRHERGVRPELECSLRKFKPAFINLLRNQNRNEGDADLIRKAQSDGIVLPGLNNQPQTISPQLVEEIFILSELFNINEMLALQLILQGEELTPNYPTLTRGLVAVLVYYSSRKDMVQSLRSLIQARSGLSWVLPCADEVIDLATSFTQQILEEGMVDRILVLLGELNWDEEVKLLYKHMALGDAKHRRQISDLFQEIRQALADCLFCYAAQSGLPKKDTLRLFDYLSNLSEDECGPNGEMTSVNLTLTMAALYALDISVIFKMDDGAPLVKELPILNDGTFVPCIHREFISKSNRKWKTESIKSILQLAWAMTLASLRNLSLYSTSLSDFIDEDEIMLELALSNRVFYWLPETLINCKTFAGEEFYLRRIHQIITDFIYLMPLKVKELRNRADDSARNKLMHEHEGIQYCVPTAGKHFVQLLTTISYLYRYDQPQLGLVLEFWCPMADPSSSNNEKNLSLRQISLYKFVRSAGDFLMPSLYTPYVNMLISLAGHPLSALHCYNLLKLNGSGAQGGSNTVSWDHFFASLRQYYANLRQENTFNAVATIYRGVRSLTRGISPSEVQGLVAVIKLFRTVSYHSEVARVAMVENPEWQPIMLLMGLLGCAVPTNLKSEMMLALSTIAKSADFNQIIWQCIEASHLVSNAYNSSKAVSLIGGGLLTELDDVESRIECYSLSRAFLTLIETLVTQSAIPNNLDQGHNHHGFDPYLCFIRDSIFLRFNTRSYKDSAEKWTLAKQCLKIFLKLLTDYEPSPRDFSQIVYDSGTPSVMAKHPGFQILLHLLQSSELLRMILYILDEGCSLFDTYTPFAGKSCLEAACLYSLQLLQNALNLQVGLLENARLASNVNLILTPLDKLLLDINPRSGKPDHMLNVTKYIGYSWWLPVHALSAIRVLTLVASSTTAQPALLATLSPTKQIAAIIVKGFCDILDSDQEEFNDESFEQRSEEAEYDDAEFQTRCISEARVAVVELLQAGVAIPAPSLSHFLLGFDVSHKSIRNTTLQSPGVMGVFRSPFHAILAFLKPKDLSTPSSTFYRSPNLCQVSFRLIYSLACNPQTSEATLRYLRSSDIDFICQQLALLPYSGDGVNALNTRSMAWLLKTVAIELRVVSSARLRSAISRLNGLFLDAIDGGIPSEVTEFVSVHGIQSETSVQGFHDIVTNVGFSSSVAQFSRSISHPTKMFNYGSGRTSSLKLSTISHQHRLLAILNVINFQEEIIDSVKWEVFDEHLIKQTMLSCEVCPMNGDNIGGRSVDINRLHKILKEELVNFAQSGVGTGQKQIVQDEIQSVLRYVVKWNYLQEQFWTQRQLLDAWRQVTEVLLCVAMPLDILTVSTKQRYLLDLLQTLLNKVLQDDTLPELSNQVSGVILLLLTALRQTYTPMVDATSFDLVEVVEGSKQDLGSTYMSLLDDTRNTTELHSNNVDKIVYSATLQVILKDLIKWIAATNSSAQRVRVNLYAALLNYLRIGKVPSSQNAIITNNSNDEVNRLTKANLEVLVDFGHHFLDFVCRDSISGHDIRRILALSVLDELIALERGRGPWFEFLCNQGYLGHLVDSLVQDDSQLLSLLSPTFWTSGSTLSLRPLFAYESKMTLLSRVASSSVFGAEALLATNLIGKRLSEMKVFSEGRPVEAPPKHFIPNSTSYIDQSDEHENDFPSLFSRYRQILFPAIRLCQAVISSVGGQNSAAAQQVFSFVSANDDLFSGILRSATSSSCLTLVGLEELSHVTGLLSRCTGFHGVGAFNADRIQRQMISPMLQYFAFNERIVQQIRSQMSLASDQSLAVQYALKINANCLIFLSNISIKGGFGSKERIVFSPSLNIEAPSRDQGYVDGGSRLQLESGYGCLSTPYRGRTTPLSCLVLIINSLCDHIGATRIELDQFRQSLKSINHLSSAEMATFLSTVQHSTEKLSVNNKRSLAKDSICNFIEQKQREIRLAFLCLENSLNILWRHLEYFLVYFSASTAMDDLSLKSDSFGDPGYTGVDFNRLRENAKKCFNDAFFMRIEEVTDVSKLNISKNFPQMTSTGLINSMSRRLRRISFEATSINPTTNNVRNLRL